MKFTCNVGDFREAYNMASLTLDKVKSASETRFVLLQALTNGNKHRVLVFSTDGVACSLVKVAATVDEPGAVLIEPREIGQTLPNLDPSAKIEFTLKSGRLQCRCGNFKPKCATADPAVLNEYVKQLPFKAKADLEIPAWKLKEVFERTLCFAAKGENLAQAFLQNVYLRTSDKGLEAYAANGAILAKARVNGLDLKEGEDLKVDIPARAVPALQKILSNPQFKAADESNVPMLKIIIARNTENKPHRLYLKTDDIFYGISLSSNHIPDKAVDGEATQLASTVATVQLNRAELVATVRRCEPFLPVFDKAKAMRISLKDNIVTFYDVDGEELDKLSGTGESSGEAVGTLDPLFVMGALNAAPEEITTLRFMKSKAAVMFSSGADAEGRSFYVVGCMHDKAPAKKAPAAPAPAPAEGEAAPTAA